MSNFSERANQYRTQSAAQAEAEKKQQRIDELKQRAAAITEEQARINEIKKDVRYQRLVELSRSPELVEAFDYFEAEYLKKFPDNNVSPITYEETLKVEPNHPVGWVYVKKKFGDVRLTIGFTWRDEPTEAIYHPEVKSPNIGKGTARNTPAWTEGYTRHAGLSIEIVNESRMNSTSGRFEDDDSYSLEELLHRLLKYSAIGAQKHFYEEDAKAW